MLKNIYSFFLFTNFLILFLSNIKKNQVTFLKNFIQMLDGKNLSFFIKTGFKEWSMNSNLY